MEIFNCRRSGCSGTSGRNRSFRYCRSSRCTGSSRTAGRCRNSRQCRSSRCSRRTRSNRSWSTGSSGGNWFARINWSNRSSGCNRRQCNNSFNDRSLLCWKKWERFKHWIDRKTVLNNPRSN